MSHTFVAFAWLVMLLAIIVWWLVELRRSPLRFPVSAEHSDRQSSEILATRVVPTTSGSGELLVDLQRKEDERGVLYVVTGTVYPDGFTFSPYTLCDPVDVMVRWMEITGDVLNGDVFEATRTTENRGEAMN